ncbi:unnamed protein product [Alopecurus aequalis]
MFHGGSGGGGGIGNTCVLLPLGKYLRRAFRGSGRGKPRLRDKEYYARQRSSSSLSSVELISSASSLSSSASFSSASMTSSSSSSSTLVVRVVLWSGVVEVYAGVVLACTVIGRHPPGLCLAHTDVFSNPHRATLRPLEPLFPGQKFFLLPETTVRKLQRDIPLDSPFADKRIHGGAADGEIEEEDEETSTDTSPSRSRSWSEEHRKPVGAAPERCCANDYYKNRERWAESQFESMVERGLATEQSLSTRRSAADRTDKKRRRRTKQQRRDLLGGGALLTPWTARSWEPSLAPVQEEAAPSSPEEPQTTSPEVRTTDYDTH